MSNNQKTNFTDQEIVTTWMFAHLNDKFQKKQMHQFIQEYWAAWFPALPSYQTFVHRLNQLEPTFQTLGASLQAQVTANLPREMDTLVDSLPIMLAQQGPSYTAKVARDLADSGYCAAKKTRFHGLRLHVLARRRTGKLPVPDQVWLCASRCHYCQTTRPVTAADDGDWRHGLCRPATVILHGSAGLTITDPLQKTENTRPDCHRKIYVPFSQQAPSTN